MVISAANADGATNNILWIYQAFYPINNGQIDVENASRLPSKTINFVGEFNQPVRRQPRPKHQEGRCRVDAPSRLFEVIGDSTST